ncbi:hypothetical protein ACFX59_04710 [Sphingomonas sp. NCPPB 2930]|uniref:hypothetical protein n=1 Tax=Sphingomonas sp. NCPPB 2930 TaxID=3162788 RepID=UPI0036D99A8B
MAKWHRSRRADLGLRALGAILCGLAYLAIRTLFALPSTAMAAHLLPAELATAGFLSASAGSALAMLGAHLFDDMMVSARW